MSVEHYYAPETADEVLELAASHEDARLVAGGTDLVVADRRGRLPLAGTLIALHRVEGLRGFETDARGNLWIGALTTHADLENTPEVRSKFSAMADAAALVGSPATRNLGTVGGNIINASPAMELGAPLLVHDAEISLASKSRERVLSFDELIAGPGQTNAEPDELVTGVTLAQPDAGTGSAYVRLQYRRAMEIAVVGAAAVLTLDGDTVRQARLALAAVAPRCARVPDAEEALLGEPLSEAGIDRAARLALKAAAPISDVRAPAGYRQELVRVIARRALIIAARRARGQAVSIPASEASPSLGL
jgi:CO/xanthine dehydrogenase FAD-binding subunit